MDDGLEPALQKKQARQVLKERTASLCGETLAAFQKAQSRHGLLQKKDNVEQRVSTAGLNLPHNPPRQSEGVLKVRVLAFELVLISNIFAHLDHQPRYLLDTISLLGLQVISLSLFFLVYMVMLGCKNFKN